MNEKNPHLEAQKETPVKWYGYVVLILGILFFSGFMKGMFGGVLDFNTLLGGFGKLGTLAEGGGSLASNFRGSGGTGAKDGFMMALTVIPTVMFALAMVSVIEYFDGLRAAQKLLTPILRPLLGIPGIAGLALISSLQTADAGAGMTNDLYQKGLITESERNIFTAFQYTGGGTITNLLLIGAVFFGIMEGSGVSTAIPMVVVFAGKILSANVVRILENGGIKKGKKEA
ncbi:MAG: hypothetical protein IJ443_04365 [Firmicutes bacterium]|nr:hypothetical protein [Bacillota bacterium]